MEKKEQAQSDLNFESALTRLQETVKKLESGELSLEDSLKGFEEGVKLTRFCQQALSAAEQKVEILMQESAGEQLKTEAFSPERPSRGK